MKQLPREARRCICQIRRVLSDWLTGTGRRLVAPNGNTSNVGAESPIQLEIGQPIPPTDYAAAKIHNLQIAAALLQNSHVPPGGILSFWRVVGHPTKARGFLPGRSLLGGRLTPDYGGGLCQLSGIIYHLSLLAGLEILERHPHSRDIYEDNTRYAPLGSDATVAFGFKDLRIVNNLLSPICFTASVTPDRISVALRSVLPIEKHSVEFVRTNQRDGVIEVETRRQRPGERGFQVLDVSTYRRLD